MRKPRVLRRRTLRKTPYVTLYTAVVDFGGPRKRYYVSQYGRRIGLLLLRGNSVLLVRQYRFVAGGLTWEIPGGRIDEGEAAVDAAARECWEETGWSSRDVRELTFYIPGTDIIDNPTQICVGRALRREGPRANPETTGSRWVPIDTCLDWIRCGKIVCGMTAMAILAHRALSPGKRR